jgi:hypothetical protein
MHEIAGVVDIGERHHMVIIGPIWIMPCMYQSTISGTLVVRTAESGAFPAPPSDQLERTQPQMTGTRHATKNLRMNRRFFAFQWLGAVDRYFFFAFFFLAAFL